MHIDEGRLPFRNHETYYRVTRSSSERTPGRPLVVVHGGAGCTHDYLLSLVDLVRDHRPVIHYDQLGNGLSTHLPDAPKEFWNVELFLDELDNLLRGLGIDEDYDLLGQSWGGMLAAEHAVRRPAGLRHLVIANSPASMPLWRAAAERLRLALPEATRRILDLHERNGTIDSDEYKAATTVFYDRHVCRVVPQPEEVQRTFGWVEQDPTVYHAMNGPTEFHVIGSIRDWTIEDRLGSVTAKTLILNGRHDEATDETVMPFVERIPGANWHRFEESSHMPHWEERALYMELVDAFLSE